MPVMREDYMVEVIKIHYSCCCVDFPNKQDILRVWGGIGRGMVVPG